MPVPQEQERAFLSPKSREEPAPRRLCSCCSHWTEGAAGSGFSSLKGGALSYPECKRRLCIGVSLHRGHSGKGRNQMNNSLEKGLGRLFLSQATEADSGVEMALSPDTQCENSGPWPSPLLLFRSH